MTCGNITGVCPGTEVTLCTCSITGPALQWNLPGESITFTGEDIVGTNRTAIPPGVFVATLTSITGGRESVLRYIATEPLVNGDIMCQDVVTPSNSPEDVVSTVTLATGNKKFTPTPCYLLCTRSKCS